MFGSIGIARQGADARKGARLEEGAVAAAEQGGLGLEEVQQLGKTAGRDTVTAWLQFPASPLLRCRSRRCTRIKTPPGSRITFADRKGVHSRAFWRTLSDWCDNRIQPFLNRWSEVRVLPGPP